MTLVGILIGVVLVGFLVASLFVRRYRERPTPELGWTATNEVFRDPTTDRLMRVWVDRAGARHYVEEGRQPT